MPRPSLGPRAHACPARLDRAEAHCQIGQFINNPQGVAVDGSGNVFVADTSNHRIQKFACPFTPTCANGGIPCGAACGTCGDGLCFAHDPACGILLDTYACDGAQPPVCLHTIPENFMFCTDNAGCPSNEVCVAVGPNYCGGGNGTNNACRDLCPESPSGAFLDESLPL